MDLKKIRQYFELNKNGTITLQNQWDTTEEVPRRILVVSNVDIRKEGTEINNLIFHPKNKTKQPRKKSKRNTKQAEGKKL